MILCLPRTRPADYTLGHVLLGLITTQASPFVAVLTATGFIFYELARNKPGGEKFDAYAQFGSGYLLGRAAMELR